MNNLLTDVEFRKISNTIAAGTDDTTDCTIIDMKDFDEVTFVCSLGTVVNTGVVTFRVGQAATNATGDMVVSTATSGAITSDGTNIALSNKALILTVTKPSYRYLEAQIVRATANATVENVWAILSKARSRATSQPAASVYSSAIHASPAAA